MKEERKEGEGGAQGAQGGRKKIGRPLDDANAPALAVDGTTAPPTGDRLAVAHASSETGVQGNSKNRVWCTLLRYERKFPGSRRLMWAYNHSNKTMTMSNRSYHADM